MQELEGKVTQAQTGMEDVESLQFLLSTQLPKLLGQLLPSYKLFTLAQGLYIKHNRLSAGNYSLGACRQHGEEDLCRYKMEGVMTVLRLFNWPSCLSGLRGEESEVERR